MQGPMTRVSDTADFASAVAEAGALPFLALGLLPGPQVARLLQETERKLGSAPWGIGILGFLPKELREEQLREVRKCAPHFAIIAGGRPDQVQSLESDGIRTYLHVPSPGLLRIFLKAGSRRLIFEGRECGGHVGPLSSFVLWELMTRVMLDHLAATESRGDDYNVLYAGGIHDALSASIVAALAAPLTERGVRVGVLLGTSYLFTKEAVATGAIVEGFQQEAVACDRTVLLESGVGHATRCADTPFGKQFTRQKDRLVAEGRTGEEIREVLELLNLGRLRIASKGLRHGEARSGDNGGIGHVSVDEETQRREGLYMIGQVAALRSGVCAMEELHKDVSRLGAERLDAFAPKPQVVQPADRPKESRPTGQCDIAIIGMSCMFPKAGNLNRYWENILHKVSAIAGIPSNRWDCGLYYDSDRRARDKVYSRWGAFLDEMPFDPVRYGMPPNSLPSVEPLHLLVLEAVRHALGDAGYSDRPFDRDHTSVILGAGGGVADLGLGYGFRSLLPHYIRIAGGTADEAAELIERLDGVLPEWTEDSFPGLLLNVAAGRVANRFDLGGANYTVDAACASSLAAVQLGVNELESRSSNMVIAGGADTMQNPFAYMCFSKTQALSPTGQCRTFDESANGVVIGEGVAIVVLKRADDALRDGDRIYAVIKGVGSSSDGKDKGLTAPRPAGQIRALKRAYTKAGLGPETVELIEAHGTGTVVGDQTEVESLTRMFNAAGAKRQSCALGSVKSGIGHTKAAAGVAGLLKAALALYHKVLPPTVGVTKPNPKADFPQSPFYVNAESRPWLARLDHTPRRAGVSAFGFGGTNFHAVLEEYDPGRQSASKRTRVERSRCASAGYVDGGIQPTTNPPTLREWPAELFLWRAESVERIVGSLDRISAAIEQGAEPLLRDLAAAVCRSVDAGLGTGRATRCHCLAVVADSLDDLVSKLATAKLALNSVDRTGVSGYYDFRDPRGVYYSADMLVPEGKIAFVFPGQGSQSVDMLRDLAVAYPGVREVFEEADRYLVGALDQRLSSLVFPQPRFTDEERTADEAALTQTNVAQPAMGTADVAMYGVLTGLGIRPDLACGHSYGEYVALCAAGVIGFGDLIPISEARGRFITDAARGAPGTMAAVNGNESAVAGVVGAIDGVVIANINAPAQTVISGTDAGVEEALKRLSEQGISGRRIRVSCAFHSSLVNGALEPLRESVGGVSLSAPQIPVFSNTTASPYPSDPAAIRARLVEHLVNPVRFADEVRAMYDAGARVFVEVGPGNTLSGLIERTLEGRSFIAVATDQPGRNGLLQLVHALAQLAAGGVVFDSAVLFAQRTEKTLDLDRLVEQTRPAPLPPTTWMVNGARAVPLDDRLELTAGSRTTPVTSPSVPTSSAPAPAAVDLPPPATGVRPEAPIELDGHDPILSAHHRLMAKFLETQKSVMCAYLKDGGSTATGAEPVPPDAATAARGPRAAGETTPLPTSELRPAVESPGPSSADEPSPAYFTRQELITRLVGIVSDRTGYPPEMLDIELDLEADLGIDSIKRVEIIGALQSDSILPEEPADAEIEALAKLKTLGAIADWIREHTVEVQPTPPSGELQPARRDHHDPAHTESVPRMLLETVECETPECDRPASRGGVVVITDDEHGVASSLAEGLTSRGLTAVVIAVTRDGESDGRRPRVSLPDPRAAREFVEQIRSQCGPVSALIHLLPLGDHGFTPADQPSRCNKALSIELNSLFNLVQHLESDLREGGSGSVIVATRMGGTFASAASAESVDFRPVHGGVCGFAKALAREWTDVACKALDFELDAPTGTIVSALLYELDARDGIVEVGYQSGRRVTLRPVDSPLRTVEGDGSSYDSDALRGERASNADPGGVSLCADSIVLITGGARGITAEVAKELAERFKCTLVLAGRSPLPPEHESSHTAHLSGARELKGALLKEIEASGEKPSPARVETVYKRLCREREIRANLAEMREGGANVEYHAVDVTDGDAFGALIDALYDRFGRLDGVIHGAGVVEDKLIRDKTPESFQRVVSPKVAGAEVLASRLHGDSLGFLFFFSSTTARYGNRGQCDYAAANEVLNKLAIWLNGRWPGRVASLNWGPWESSGGMVSPELARQLEKAGIRLIPPSAGRQALVDELLYGQKEEAEVVLGGPLDAVHHPVAQREQAPGHTAKS
ncbi:MAG: SDR family NAD(P)-dependent oxidoreductase, partial [Phycisphaerales bacterium]